MEKSYYRQVQLMLTWFLAQNCFTEESCIESHVIVTRRGLDFRVVLETELLYWILWHFVSGLCCKYLLYLLFLFRSASSSILLFGLRKFSHAVDIFGTVLGQTFFMFRWSVKLSLIVSDFVLNCSSVHWVVNWLPHLTLSVTPSLQTWNFLHLYKDLCSYYSSISVNLL
jgi:hypothetical protein